MWPSFLITVTFKKCLKAAAPPLLLAYLLFASSSSFFSFILSFFFQRNSPHCVPLSSDVVRIRRSFVSPFVFSGEILWFVNFISYFTFVFFF